MLPYLKTIRWYLFFNFLFGVVSNICTALLPYFTQALIKGDYQVALYGYSMSVAGYLSCNYIQMILDWKQGIIFSTTLKNEWFRSLLGLSHHDFKQKTVAEYISYQSNDLDSLEKDYLPPLMSFIKQILRIIIYAFIISRTINPIVSLILIFSTGISIQIPKIVGKLTANRRQVYLKKQGDYYRTLEDLLMGHHLVNKLTMSHFLNQQKSSLKNLQDKYFKYGLTKITGILLTGVSFEFISLVLFIYLAYSLSHQQLGIPEVVASFGYINAFSEPIQEILYDLQMLESVKPVIKSFQNIVTLFNSFNEKFREEDFEKIPPQSLSGGQQQRMYLNREKNRKNPLLILDEPFSALDTNQFKMELERVLELPSAVIVTLHRQNELLSKFDQVWEIKNGELVILK